MTHQENNPEAKQPGRNRLGKLYPSLVNRDVLPDESLDAAATKQQVGSINQAGWHTKLNIEALSLTLTESIAPLEVLKHFVTTAFLREKDSHRKGGSVAIPPSDFELHLAQRLKDAGILDAQDITIPCRVVRLRTNGLFYLRATQKTLSYEQKIQLLTIESALNTALFAERYFLDANMASETDLLAFEQELVSTMMKQSRPRCATTQSTQEDGEWVVRKAISLHIESLRLSQRLVTEFRTNVHKGIAAFRVNLALPEQFPKTFLDAGGNIKEATYEDLCRAATAYNLRLGMLITASAFRSSQKINEVWLSGICDTDKLHACLFSFHITREQFAETHITEETDPLDIFKLWNAQIYAVDGMLHAVHPLFTLDNEIFCPPSRYDFVESSQKRLDSVAAHALGTDEVSGLSIDEGQAREEIITKILRNLSSSTEENVRTILSYTANSSDPTVRAAGERVVSRFIKGTLAEDDFEAIAEEFVDGGVLSIAVTKAQRLITEKNYEEAESMLLEALDTVDRNKTYTDTDTTQWRVFMNYVDRVLYNRILSNPEKNTRLAPMSYFEAHLLVSIAQTLQGQTQSALQHARRAVEIAPLSMSARLHLSHCLEESLDISAAANELKSLLMLAHDPESIGFGYYRMAFFQWRLRHLKAAQACYQFALKFLPGATFIIGTETAILAQTEPEFSCDELSDEEIYTTLVHEQIPVAPTNEVSTIFLDGTRASLDAELFSVAKNFMINLGIMTKDDVYFDMLNSIEGEPDR